MRKTKILVNFLIISIFSFYGFQSLDSLNAAPLPPPQTTERITIDGKPYSVLPLNSVTAYDINNATGATISSDNLGGRTVNVTLFVPVSGSSGSHKPPTNGTPSDGTTPKPVGGGCGGGTPAPAPSPSPSPSAGTPPPHGPSPTNPPTYNPPAYNPPTYTPPSSAKYSCNQSTGQCYQNPNGPYSGLASCQNSCFRSPCTIDIFTINDKDTSPIRVWVTQLNQGHWSASDYCDNCNISCSPYPECLWQQNNIGTGGPGSIYQFKLKEYGTYTYTLTCFNSYGDQPSETLQVNAVNLPWWREIVPVLPGSLWGAIKK